MSESIEVPPFVLDCSESQAVFRFDPEYFEQGCEYPPNLEGMIAGVLDSKRDFLDDRTVLVDLEGLPAISSKQLGAMLAVRKACKSHGKIKILNLRPNVRELLYVTKLDDFFDWD